MSSTTALVRVDVPPVALDAMGGDHGVGPNVEGAIQAVREDDARVILVGDESILAQELKRLGATSLLGSALTVRHAPEVIEMDEKPAQAVRRKKGSSMRVACELVKANEACGAISAGNSGAMMAVGLFVFGRIKGVLRPCIAAAFPSRARSGFSVLVDAGANIDCTPEHLFQFGVMGAVYMEHAYGNSPPVVGVLSNGTEDSKGTELAREALRLVRQSDLRCVGFCEGNQVMFGEVDVVITDGFSGNVMLKTGEGVARFVMENLRAGFQNASPLVKLAGLVSKKMFRGLRKTMDHREFGAAPLLGLGAPAFIAHGSSDAYAIRKAIGAVRRHAQNDITQQIGQEIQRWKDLSQPSGDGDSVAS